MSRMLFNVSSRTAVYNMTMFNWKLRVSGASLFLSLVGATALPVLCGSLANSVAIADEAPAKYTGLPYNGKAVALPGIIQAEEYDIAPGAANGISFNYNSPATRNDLRKSGDSIGLARFGNGHVSIKGDAQDPNQTYVGWTHDGEWLRYSVRVKESGAYVIGGQFSAAGKDGTISIAFSPAISTGPLSIPTTAGYQPGVEVYHVWEKLDHLAEVELPKGDYVMTVKIEKSAGLNFDYLTVSRKAAMPIS